MNGPFSACAQDCRTQHLEIRTLLMFHNWICTPGNWVVFIEGPKNEKRAT